MPSGCFCPGRISGCYTAHGGEDETDHLDDIIKNFNERWFHGWDATPEDQRVKFVTLSKHVRAHPDYKIKVEENNDSQTRDLAFKKILDEVMSEQRKKELELYKLYAKLFIKLFSIQ